MLEAGGSNGAVPAEFRDRLDAWKVRSPVVKVNAALTELPALDRSRRRDLARGRHGQLPRRPRRRAGGVRGVGPRRARDRLHRDLLADARTIPRSRRPTATSSRVFCQYAPAGKTVEDWDAGLREDAADQVFGMIERFAPGFRDQVVEYEVLGPPDIEERIGLTGGCIFQGECFPDQMWENRLASRTPVDGLYLCGAATHPGGSVIGLNGRNAAMAVIEDAKALA